MPEENLVVTTLTHQAAVRRMNDLAGLDAAVRSEVGEIYSEESWTRRHFALDLPGKWDCSAMLLRGDELHGFWIASAKDRDVLYTHRVAVAASSRGGGGRMLVDWVIDCARSRGYVALALRVRRGNEAAAGFYRKMGFKLVQDTPWNHEHSEVYVLDLGG